jgi:predicted hydrolases of HD superfamily
MSSFYSMLFRMKYIDRWSLMRSTRKENLSEHTLEVAFIAHCLCVIEKRRFGRIVDTEKVLLGALFHDTSEVITGDLPTPVKYYNPDIKTAYKKIEKTAEQKLLSLLPEDFKDDFTEVYSLDENTKQIIKAADKLSALIKCTEEVRSGNNEFSKALKSTKNAIDDMQYPPAEVFIEEFLPSFSLSLDEQTGF